MSMFNNKKPKEAEQNSISSHVSNSNDIKAIELLGDKAVDKKDWASAKVYFKKILSMVYSTFAGESIFGFLWK